MGLYFSLARTENYRTGAGQNLIYKFFEMRVLQVFGGFLHTSAIQLKGFQITIDWEADVYWPILSGGISGYYKETCSIFLAGDHIQACRTMTTQGGAAYYIFCIPIYGHPIHIFFGISTFSIDYFTHS